MDTDRDYESESKRVRRKPVWAKDYVFSCRMVNTKQTKRKDNSLPMSEETKTRCSWCKGLFEPGTPYEQHLIKCYRNRWTCYSCGCTFKQKSYLEKHKRTQHQAWASVNRMLKKAPGPLKSGQKKTSTVTKVVESEKKDMSKKERKVNDDSEKRNSDADLQRKEETVPKPKKDEGLILVSGNNSDWDSSPNVSLEGDLQISEDSEVQSNNGSESSPRSKEIQGDEGESEVNREKAGEKSEEAKPSQSDVSLLKGRLFRKATTPVKPLAPQKHKLKSTDTLNMASDSKRSCQSQGKKILIQCSRSDKEKSSEQETIIFEDGESIFKNSVLTAGGLKRQKKDDSMIINVGDVFPEGRIDTGSIQLRLSTGGKVEMEFTYLPADV